MTSLFSKTFCCKYISQIYLICSFSVFQGPVLCLCNNEVKSRAVVKYSAAPPPATYALLQEKTDLKLPPANWLRQSAQLGPAGTTVFGSSSKSKPFSRYNYFNSPLPLSQVATNTFSYMTYLLWGHEHIIFDPIK